jgi:hypothetical protein
MLIYKHKNYYEPIYYLRGNGKSATMECLFDSHLPEIKNCIEMVKENCQEKETIQWNQVLQNTVQKYKLNIPSVKINKGESLMKTMEMILVAIKNNQLSKEFIPDKQYMDSYQKVFAIRLRNGLFLPVLPSKLYLDLPYEQLQHLDDIRYLDFRKTYKYLHEISEKTNISCDVVEKIIDKKKNMIVGVVLQNDRIVPVQKSPNTNHELRESYRKIYTDVDYYIQHKSDFIPDRRIEIVNRKNYEDESYQRFRFEISRYLQSHKEIRDTILSIINKEGKNLEQKRRKLYH